jgi:hypothetical protein
MGGRKCLQCGCSFSLLEVFMALSMYLIIALMLLLFSFYIRKPLNFLQNSIVFMIISIIARQYLTLIWMKFERINLTDEHLRFMSFLLYRDLFIPITVFIFVNFYLRMRNRQSKVFLFAGILLLMMGLEYLNVFFEIIEFVHWNLFLAGIVDGIYLLIGLVTTKMMLFIKMQGIHNENI